MTNGALGLEPDDFWGSHEQKNAAKDQLRDRVLEEELRGLIADAPPQVSLLSRGSLPIIAYFIRDLRDEVHLDVRRQLLLVGSDHQTHEVWVAPALWSDKVFMPKAPPPADDPGPGAMISMYDIDAAARLGLAGLPGRYSFELILREWHSERLEVELLDSGYRDDAAAQLIAERRRSNPQSPARVWPPLPQRHVGVSGSYGRMYPRYGDAAQAPDPPSEEGIELELDRAVVSNERCMLRGSFCLPTLPRERVEPPRLHHGERERRRPEVGDARAEAVVPLTLIMTGSVSPGPFILSLKLPVYELERSGDDALARGRFELDLFELADMPRSAETFFVHAFHGRHVIGPLTVAVVSPEMIR